MDLKKFESVLVLLDDARVPLEIKRSLTIKQLGPKLLEPLLDQSLDPGDIEKISGELFKAVKQTPEYKKYVSVRKEQNKKVVALYRAMEKAKDADWDALMLAELSATTKNDILALAKTKNIKINIKI